MTAISGGPERKAKYSRDSGPLYLPNMEWHTGDPVKRNDSYRFGGRAEKGIELGSRPRRMEGGTEAIGAHRHTRPRDEAGVAAGSEVAHR